MTTITTTSLIKDCCKNLLISCGVFAVFFALLYLAELNFVPKGTLLDFSSLAFCVGIPASVIGVGHILTIRNPKNYIGFIPGLIMEALQAWQFYLLGNYDLMCFYIFFFMPIQLATLLRWEKKKDSNESTPVWMSSKETLIAILVFILIVAADYLLLTFVVEHNALVDNLLVKLLSGSMMAAAILANYGLFFHKKDAWIYWVINSVVGLVLYLQLAQYFNVVLYIFFIVINTIALIAWVRPQQK